MKENGEGDVFVLFSFFLSFFTDLLDGTAVLRNHLDQEVDPLLALLRGRGTEEVVTAGPDGDLEAIGLAKRGQVALLHTLGLVHPDDALGLLVSLGGIVEEEGVDEDKVAVGPLLLVGTTLLLHDGVHVVAPEDVVEADVPKDQLPRNQQRKPSSSPST